MKFKVLSCHEQNAYGDTKRAITLHDHLNVNTETTQTTV